jgi:outer membrane protein OmpA-like peptidoglycan-associated protein
MKFAARSFLALSMLACAVAAHAQQPTMPRWGIKTNLLYDATATINLGAEFRLGGHTSIDIPLNYNPWEFGENRKWKHAMAQPEFRYWLRETFRGHFFGVHATGAIYNVGNLPEPMAPYMRAHRFQGWLAGGGLSYGYRFNFRNPNWAIEATLGGGYLYKDYDVYECVDCGDKLKHVAKHYLGPTKLALSVVRGFGGAGGERKPRRVRPERPVRVPEQVPAADYRPVLAPSFVRPEVEAVKLRSESGQAYLDFASGQSTIVRSFRNNAVELQRIYATIELIKNDPDMTITGIAITGHASPEGSAASNKSLSARRAEALRDHIAHTYALRQTLFRVEGAGEDWTGLDSLVSYSMLPQKTQLLEIIRSGADPDVREQRLMAVSIGIPYRAMRADFYPRLRRSDYTIEYTVKAFTVEQGKEVMQTRPASLSLNEMFMIAETYEIGSEAFNNIFETAARLYPDSDVANLNAAASALGRSDAVSAAYYLARVRAQNEVYWNNMGMLQWLHGNEQAAAEAFDRAGTTGSANALELSKRRQSPR